MMQKSKNILLGSIIVLLLIVGFFSYKFILYKESQNASVTQKKNNSLIAQSVVSGTLQNGLSADLLFGQNLSIVSNTSTHEKSGTQATTVYTTTQDIPSVYDYYQKLFTTQAFKVIGSKNTPTAAFINVTRNAEQDANIHVGMSMIAAGTQVTVTTISR